MNHFAAYLDYFCLNDVLALQKYATAFDSPWRLIY